MFDVKTFKWLVICGPPGAIEANVCENKSLFLLCQYHVLLDATCMVCRFCSCLKVVAGLVVAFVIPPLIVIRVQRLSVYCMFWTLQQIFRFNLKRHFFEAPNCMCVSVLLFM